jgi:chitodextrinase
MSIKHSASSTQVTNVQIVDSDNMVIPNGDFVVATMIHTDGAFGPSQQHLINAGVTFGAGHLALMLESGGQINCQTDVNQSGVNVIHQTPLALNSSYLVGMRRLGTSLRSFFCPALQTAPTDGSAVSVSTKSRSINVALNSSGNVTIGQRLGSSTNRGDHSMARAFAYIGTLTDLDLAKLAYGMEITDIGKIPLWYIRGNDGSDTDDRSPNKNVTLRSTGTDPLPTGTAFNFGYVSVNRAPTVTAPSIDGDPQVGKSISAISGTVDGFPFPEIFWQWLLNGVDIPGATTQSYIPVADDELDKLGIRQSVHSTQGDASAVSAEKTVAASPTAVYVTPMPNDSITQVRSWTDRTATVPFAGTYTGGEQPAKIEYRLYDPDGLTLRKGWADIGATISAGGTWVATPTLPSGQKKFRPQVRMLRGDGTVLAESALHTNRFGVGLVGVLAGSSSAQTWGRSSTGTVATDSVSQIRHPDGWSTATTLGTKMADYISARVGMVVGMISGGISGSSIGGNDGWSVSDGGKWGGIRDVVASIGGRVGFMMFTGGSNDASAAAVTGIDSHVAKMQSVFSIGRGLNTAEANPNMPIILSGYNRRWAQSASKTVAEFNTSSNYLREAEKVLGKLPNVYLWQSTHYPLSGDGTHLADAGFDQQTADMAWFAVEMFGGRYPRGPQITKFSWSGDTVFIDVTHGNGTDLSPALGGTAITVADASGTPTRVSTQRVSATRYSAKYDRALVAPVTTQHLSGGDFEYTAPILDNGAVPMPMSVETLMATVAATTAEPEPDTAVPVMVGSISATNVTATSATLAWSAATDNVGIASYEYSLDGGTNYISVGTDRTVTRSNLTASTNYPVRVRAKDAAGHAAVPLQYSLTTIAAPDTTAPVMAGSISIANVTTAGATISWPAATDGVGVVGYEYSINGGTTYSDVGAARTATVSGRPASTVHQVRVRAYDAAGNRATPLAASFTTLAEQPAQNAVVASTVAESRRVSFPGGTRVVAFGTVPGVATPNAPYLEAGRWWSEKHPLDERYWVADVTIDLDERGTTAKEVVAIEAGVTVLEQPVIQGKLILVKLGGFNAATGAVNFCTFRVTCANGERFDRTIGFKQPAGAWWIDKDADDQSYYVADIGNDLVDSGTTATAVKALPVGVVELVPAVIQGPLILVKLGGMDTLPAGANYCDFRIDCANGERFYRSIQFNRVDN